MSPNAHAFIGTQGWYYGSWVGSFYPEGTHSADMLASYGRAFPAVEVDSTFYQIPAEPVVERWRESVPDGFLFALKLPQEITHERQLEDCDLVLERFLHRIALLQDRLGPVLVQLSPTFAPTDENRARLSRFVTDLSREFRWAIEFRDERWLTDNTLEFLSLNGVALALVDGRWIARERVLSLAQAPSTSFAYVRWMGSERRFTDYSRVQADPAEEFALWGPVLEQLANRVGRLFGFVNNHFQGHAPHSARQFQQLLGQVPVAPESLREQVELF